ncbi:MAG: MarR family transcriptional regulator [Desulfovibrio sp.]|nr:MarR family transcriptional regulator [Desulfovibrio sp.]
MTITAYRLLNSTLRRRLKRSGIDLTPEQWGVLVLLWERKSATQDELAAALCVDKSTMSRVLSAMENKGLITRRTEPTNERKKVICAANASLGLRERGFAAAVEALRGALGGVSEQEAETCIKVLAAIKRNLRAK